MYKFVLSLLLSAYKSFITIPPYLSAYLTHYRWEIQPHLTRSKWNMGEIITLPLNSLLLHGVTAGPCFRPSRGRAWRRACLRRRASRLKQGPALTPRNNRLSNGRAMGEIKKIWLIFNTKKFATLEAMFIIGYRSARDPSINQGVNAKVAEKLLNVPCVCITYHYITFNTVADGRK